MSRTSFGNDRNGNGARVDELMVSDETATITSSFSDASGIFNVEVHRFLLCRIVRSGCLHKTKTERYMLGGSWMLITLALATSHRFMVSLEDEGLVLFWVFQELKSRQFFFDQPFAPIASN